MVGRGIVQTVSICHLTINWFLPSTTRLLMMHIVSPVNRQTDKQTHRQIYRQTDTFLKSSFFLFSSFFFLTKSLNYKAFYLFLRAESVRKVFPCSVIFKEYNIDQNWYDKQLIGWPVMILQIISLLSVIVFKKKTISKRSEKLGSLYLCFCAFKIVEEIFLPSIYFLQ